ncbi:MAG: hypothetical protein LBI10_00375 [Deltaproteobacteria bacterium]|jgi:hypothetical protein|nr:hypothetical protein [Deltaproteobacteria bacterium]
MLKKIGFIAFFGLLTLALAPALSAQELVDLDKVKTEDLNKEGPLTQKDFDVYLQFFVMSAESVKKEMEKADKADPQTAMAAAVSEFVKTNKLTATRLRYILEKVTMAIQVSNSPDQPPAQPEQPYLAISPAEAELAKTNTPKIISLLGQR